MQQKKTYFTGFDGIVVDADSFFFGDQKFDSKSVRNSRIDFRFFFTQTRYDHLVWN